MARKRFIVSFCFLAILHALTGPLFGQKSKLPQRGGTAKKAVAQSPIPEAAILDDFKSARNNGDGTPLWAPYLGEDPAQTGQLVDGTYELSVGKAPSGAYLHFFPRANGYKFPDGYAQHYLTQGKWDASYNRLTFWAKPSITVPRRDDGGGTLEFGTYIRPHVESDDRSQGAHFYHVFDVGFFADRWHYFVVNRTPQHQVGHDSNKNWPENPMSPQVNYFDGLTRFYFDTQGEGFSNSTWLLAGFEFSRVENEPDDLVASVAAVHTGKFYQVTWAGPKHIQQAYDVAFSTTSMKKAGFKRAAFGGTVSNPGNAYQGTVWQSPPMPEAKAFYVAIRPRGKTEFTEIMIPRRSENKSR